MARWDCGYCGHVATSSSAMYHSPLKLYEYAGLGLDVISTPTPDARLMQESGVRVVPLDPDDEDVTTPVKQWLSLPRRTSEQIAAVRARLAGQHTWEARVAALEARLFSADAGGNAG
jgi:glycosyltransferase involved in cell wall biosynthesis